MPAPSLPCRTRGFTARRALRAVALVVSLVVSLPTPAGAQDSTVVDSVALAVQQLERGEQWFRARCIECHATGALANPDFQLKWNGRNAFDLFERIRATMPEDDPGSLTPGTYASIVAYLLKLNGMVVGSVRLPSDSTALAVVRITFGPPPATPVPHSAAPRASRTPR